MRGLKQITAEVKGGAQSLAAVNTQQMLAVPVLWRRLC